MIKRVEICNQNRKNTGIASESEFPHVAVIKLLQIRDYRLNHNVETKCVGSLISERHVLTSFYCVNSLLKFKVTVHLGGFNFDLSDNNIKNYEVESLESKYGVTILKLHEQVIFSENIMPVCLFTGDVATSEVLLAAWNGDWRECETTLKKWHINNNAVVYSNRWQITIDESAIINYRQVQQSFFYHKISLNLLCFKTLLAGSPLQIYNPDKACQYSLIGLFELSSPGKYVFNSLHKKLRWIEYTVWPKKLLQMNFKTYKVVKNALKF